VARPLRIQYPGAVYHVTCRGNERKAIFRDDKDRTTFLDILAHSLNIYTVKLYSYVLMENHFHLLVETPLGNLGEFMRHFNITYTGYYNRRHKRVGHLYQGRYKSILIDKQEYLSMLSRYIHLNPIRTEQMKKKTAKEKINYLMKHKWSSLPGYIDEREKEGFIDYKIVLQEYGGDNERGRKRYRDRIYSDVTDGLEIKDKIIGQSILGGDTFIDWIKGRFLKGKQEREHSSIKDIRRYRAKEEILKLIEQETGKDIQEMKGDKGSMRQIVMDILYRFGGMKGVEIGRIMGVDYSTVSQGRKRLREKIKRDKNVKMLVKRIEQKLSI
jgi:putative transposase